MQVQDPHLSHEMQKIMECKRGKEDAHTECNFLSDLMNSSWPTSWNNFVFSVLFPFCGKPGVGGGLATSGSLRFPDLT